MIGVRPTPAPSTDASLSSASSYTVGTLFWLAGCLVLPIFFVTTRVAAMPSLLTGFQLTILVYSGTRLAMIIASGRIQPATAMFWLFTYVAMGVAPLAQLATGRYPTPLQDPGTILEATILILAGCCAFDAGSSIVRIRRRSQRPPLVAATERVVDRGRLEALTLVGIAGSLTFIAALGGPSAFFHSRQFLDERVLAATNTPDPASPAVALLHAVGQIPILIAFLCWSAVVLANRRGASATDYLWWGAALLLNIIVNNPISNSRYFFLTVLIAFLLIGPRLSAARFRWIIIVGVVTAIVVFPFADYFRNEPGGTPGARPQTLAESLSLKDYDQTVMAANGIWWVRSFRQKHTYGRQFAGVLLFWVPSSVWPNKPKDTGVEIGTALQLGSPNLSSPLWIEAWVDFGWMGTLLVLLALGYWTARADAIYRFTEFGRAASRNLSWIGLILPLLAGYLLILLRGPLLQAMGQLVAILIASWFVTRPSTKAVRPARAGPG